MRPQSIWQGILKLGWTLGVIFLFLLGCTAGTPQTPSLPSPSPTPQPSPTASPTATPTETPSPTPTPPCWQARIVEGTVRLAPVPPGSRQEARWVLENTGSCPWPLPLQGTPEADSPASGWEVASGPETGTVDPGQQIEVQLFFDAPSQPGEYRLTWRWTTSEGDAVLAKVTFSVTVLPPSPTPTWAPLVFVERQVTLRPGQTLNFDDGAPEIEYTFNGPNDQGLGHASPNTYFYQIYLWPPDFAQCYNAPYDRLAFNAILNPHWKIGTAYCYITNERRIGAFRIDSAYEYNGEWYVVLTYITWAVKH